MSIFRDFFVKEKPVFTGITRGLGGFGFGGAGGGAAEPVEITGGTTTAAGITPGNGYRYHVFMQSGSPQSFVVPSTRGPVSCDFLIIGGGGSGGWDVGGGGGAGGMVHGENYTIPTGTHPVSVGAGGADAAGGPPSDFRGGPNLSGNPSVVVLGGVTITGRGGGGGGGWVNPDPNSRRFGAGGGNGGGAAGYLTSVPGGSGNQDSANPGISNITDYGNNNGGATANPSPGQSGAGGGGTQSAGSDGGPGGAGGNAQPIPAFGSPLIEPEIPAPTRSAWATTVGPSGQYGWGGYGAADTESNPVQPSSRAAIDGNGAGDGGGGITPNESDPGADGIIIFRYSV